MNDRIAQDRVAANASRDRALRTLHRLTNGAAVGGTLAALGFGALGAATYRGASDVATTDQAPAAEQAAPAETSDRGSSGAAVSPTATPGPASTPAPIRVITPPTRTRSGGHVTTGGSG